MTNKSTIIENFDIKHFKLVSGEEILAIVNTVYSTYLTLEMPLLLNIMASTADRESYYFSEWMPLSEDDLTTVYINNIVAQVNITDDAKEHYIRTCLAFKDRSEEGEYVDSDDDHFDMEDMDQPNGTMH